MNNEIDKPLIIATFIICSISGNLDSFEYFSLVCNSFIEIKHCKCGYYKINSNALPQKSIDNI